MKTLHYTQAEPRKNAHQVDVRAMYDSEHAMVSHMTLQPGEQLKKHITPVVVFFFVLEGEGTVEIGDEKEVVGAGTLIDSPADIAHCWYNTSAAPLRILVTKVPKPTKKTIFV